MTVSPENRKVGINVSVKYKHIKKIDSKSGGNRSKYIWNLIKQDLDIKDEDE